MNTGLNIILVIKPIRKERSQKKQLLPKKEREQAVRPTNTIDSKGNIIRYTNFDKMGNPEITHKYIYKLK